MIQYEKSKEKEIIILKKIMLLPDELINVIKEYIPKKYFTFTNRKNYDLYHPLIKRDILNYENYIRDMIRRDNHFVFERIVQENYKKWFKINNYNYKYVIYKNYAYFVINYCIENDSSNCRKIIDDIFKELGLCKNLHKKNIIKYIRYG